VKESLKLVNIWQCYKQERGCLEHFLRLLAVVARRPVMCCINPRTLGAGARHCRSIMSCPLGAQQQTRRMLQRLSNDGTMNGLTDARPLRRPCSAYYEVCFINPRNVRAEASGVVNKRACTAYCVSLHRPTVAACLRKQLISHVPLWLAPPFTTAHLSTPEMHCAGDDDSKRRRRQSASINLFVTFSSALCARLSW